MSRSLAGDLRAARERVGAFFSGAPGWLAGIAAGVQAAALSLLVVMAPAIAAIAAAPTVDGSTAVNWGAAMAVATKIWLLAHGVPLETAEATFTLIPLGLTAVSMAIVVAVARRFTAKAWGSWVWTVVAYSTCVVGLAAVVWTPSGGDTTPLVRAGVVALVISAPSAAMGIWRAHGAEFGWVPLIPEFVRTGVRVGLGTVALIVMIAASTGMLWAVVGASSMASSASALGVDPVGGVSLALGQLIYVPVLVVWMMAWLTGVGFTFGDDNLFTTSIVATDVLPTIPLLGALPSAAGGLLVWAPASIAIVAAGAWWAQRARLAPSWSTLGAGGTATVIVAVIVGGLTASASGAAGPGALSDTGADPLPVAAVAAGLAASGYVAAALIRGAYRWLMDTLFADEEERDKALDLVVGNTPPRQPNPANL